MEHLMDSGDSTMSLSGVLGMKRARVETETGLVILNWKIFKGPLMLCAEHYRSRTGKSEFSAIVTAGNIELPKAVALGFYVQIATPPIRR